MGAMMTPTELARITRIMAAAIAKCQTARGNR
jgi:hypothetical protein